MNGARIALDTVSNLLEPDEVVPVLPPASGSGAARFLSLLGPEGLLEDAMVVGARPGGGWLWTNAKESRFARTATRPKRSRRHVQLRHYSRRRRNTRCGFPTAQ